MIDPVPETDGHVNGAGTAGTAPEAPSNSNSDFATEARGHPSIDDPKTRQADAAYLDVALSDAERLLAYAAEVGIHVDKALRDAVLEARHSKNGWTTETAAAMLAALTELADGLKPVTAETLKVCTQKDKVDATISLYRSIVVILAVIIVPFSFASFVTSAISDAIRKDIVTANDLAVRLTTKLEPLGEPAQGASSSAGVLVTKLAQAELAELQEFAASIRAIDGRARQLNHWLLNGVKDPFADIRPDPAAIKKEFQLPVPLDDPLGAARRKISTYQDVRYFAQSILDTVSVYYGGATVCFLPVLYALLGACAYLLRTFEQQVRMRTFAPSDANTARFVTAAICGAVVGLFNNFNVAQGASIPPLAVAFLVGYAVDVFFSFLEALVQTFTRSRGGIDMAPASHRPRAPAGSTERLYARNQFHRL
jgi:hypothetical protein